MKVNFADNKNFILKVSLLQVFIMLSMWLGKGQTAFSYSFEAISRVDSFLNIPMVIDMLNKWYFIGF